MATFILIPGGWQGGWIYQQVAELLTARGHKAVPVTLAGLGDKPAPDANLDSHIAEVVETVRAQGDEVVLGEPRPISGAGDFPYPQIHSLNRAGRLEVIDGIAAVRKT